MSKQCPRCGAREGEKNFVKNFCADCFPNFHKLLSLPKKIVLVQCPRCKKIRKSGEWTDDCSIEQAVRDKLKTGYEVLECVVSLDEKSKHAFIDCNLLVEGQKVSVKRESTNLFIEKKVCVNCLHESSGYYEAIIQLRGNEKRVSSLGEKLLSELEKNTVVSVERKKEGVDVLVADKHKALELVSREGYKFEVSNQLVGVKQGKRVFKATLCLRV